MTGFRTVLRTMVAAGILGSVTAVSAATSIAYTPPPLTFDLSTVSSQSTPLSQTINGLTATFTSVGDPAAFSMYNPGALSIGPNILASPGTGNGSAGLPLAIGFNVPVSSISMQFATDNDFGSATPLTLAAYSHGSLIGTAAASGSPSLTSFPQGTISYTTQATSGFNGVGIASSGTPYFAIASPTVVPNLAAIVNNAVSVTTAGPLSLTRSDTVIKASFTPNFGLTLAQTASLLGFTGFNWVQTVVSDPPNHMKDVNGNSLGTTFPDPPPGGYLGQPDQSYPFYYTKGVDLPETISTLSFFDQPRDPCFSFFLACDGDRVPFSSSVFKTELVGVLAGNIVGPELFEFTWTSNYSGAGGGVARGNNFIDDGGGTGGVTILSEYYPFSGSVPEPTTWSMIILGFSGIAFISYRRSRKDTIALTVV